MNKKIKGFTLVELLAVIVILGILLVIAVPATQKVMKQSKDNTFVTDAKAFIKAAKTQMSLQENLEDEMVFWVKDLDVETGTNYGGMVSAILNDTTGKYEYSILLRNDDEGKCIATNRTAVVPEAISEEKLSIDKILDLNDSSMNAQLSTNIQNLGNTSGTDVKSSVYLSEKAKDEKHFISSSSGIAEKKVLQKGTSVTLLGYYKEGNSTKINGDALFSVLNDSGEELFLYANSNTGIKNFVSGKYENASKGISGVESILFNVPEDIQQIHPQFPKLTPEDVEVRLLTDKDLLAYFDESEDADFYTILNENPAGVKSLFGTNSVYHLISTENSDCNSKGYISENMNLNASVCYFVNPSGKSWTSLVETKVLGELISATYPIVIVVKNREKAFLHEYNAETYEWRTISVADKDKEM